MPACRSIPAASRCALNGFLLYRDGAPVAFDGKAVSNSIRDNRDTLIQLDFSEGTAGAQRFGRPTLPPNTCG